VVTHKSKMLVAEHVASVAPAVPAPAREYTFADYCSGWTEGRLGYERQEAEKAAARARAVPPEPHGPPAPQPRGYDPVTSGLWNGRPKSILAAPAVSAPASAPAYNYNGPDQSWRDYVGPDGDISMRPRGGWGFP